MQSAGPIQRQAQERLRERCCKTSRRWSRAQNCLSFLRLLCAVFPANWTGLVNAVSPFLPPSMGSLLTSVPAPAAGDRWVAEVRREAFAAKQGRRDSQWALLWALSHARTLVYIETPLFGATAAGTAPHEVDLVALLVARLTAEKDLRVIVSVPKRIPLGRATRASPNVTTFPATLQWMHCVPRIPSAWWCITRRIPGPPGNSPRNAHHHG